MTGPVVRILLVLAIGIGGFTGIAIADPAAALHHDLTVRLDPGAHTIEVVDHIAVDGARAPIETLHLARWLMPTQIEIDGAAVPLAVEDGVIRLPGGMPGPRVIRIAYAGRRAATSEGTAGRGLPDSAIGSEGTFLPAGSGWVPQIERGAGMAVTYRLRVLLPKSQVAIATGVMVEEHIREDSYEAVFASERPHAEPSLFAGPYAVRERLHGPVRLRTYFHPQADDLAERYLDAAAAYLDAFSARIGAYPFSGFAIVSAPFPVGLGFPGMTYVSRQILPLPFMQGRSLAHEILHNWWGSGVGVAYTSGNWAEGLTTYMADYAVAVAENADAGQTMRYDWLRDFAALPPSGERPVITFVSRTHAASQAIGYGKAAFIFHMLRQEVGEDSFEQAIRRFWDRNRFSTASWQDLQEAFEAIAKTDLDWFFRQWLERPGAPVVTLHQARALKVSDDHGGGYRVSLTLRQTEEIYRLSIPIQVLTTETMVTEWIRLDAAEATIRLDVPDRPRVVVVDPGYDVFRKLHPEEAPPILRDVMLDPSTVLVTATASPEAERVADALAATLLETKPRRLAAGAIPAATVPLLLVGTGAEGRAAVDAMALGPIPEPVTSRGTAQVWAGERAGGARHLVVAAADAAALAAVQRSLPHHGRAGYLAFDQSRAIVIGNWPPDHGPMRRAFNP